LTPLVFRGYRTKKSDRGRDAISNAKMNTKSQIQKAQSSRRGETNRQNGRVRFPIMTALWQLARFGAEGKKKGGRNGGI